MVEHKKYNFKEFHKMTKDDQMRGLVDELNAMSEDMYEKRKETFFNFGNRPYHFYLEKSFGHSTYYYILRDNNDDDYDDDNRFKYVAVFSDVESKMLDGCAEISAEQQHMLMQFVIAFN